MKQNDILTEIAWLVALAIVWMAIFWGMFNYQLGHPMQCSAEGGYCILEPSRRVHTMGYLLIVVIVYAIRQYKERFRSGLVNALVFVSSIWLTAASFPFGVNMDVLTRWQVYINNKKGGYDTLFDAQTAPFYFSSLVCIVFVAGTCAVCTCVYNAIKYKLNRMPQKTSTHQ